MILYSELIDISRRFQFAMSDCELVVATCLPCLTVTHIDMFNVFIFTTDPVPITDETAIQNNLTRTIP